MDSLLNARTVVFSDENLKAKRSLLELQQDCLDDQEDQTENQPFIKQLKVHKNPSSQGQNASEQPPSSPITQETLGTSVQRRTTGNGPTVATISAQSKASERISDERDYFKNKLQKKKSFQSKFQSEYSQPFAGKHGLDETKMSTPPEKNQPLFAARIRAQSNQVTISRKLPIQTVQSDAHSVSSLREPEHFKKGPATNSSYFSHQVHADQVGKRITRLRKVNGTRQIQSFLETQKQLHQEQLELSSVVSNQKNPGYDTEKKVGMSAFYQQFHQRVASFGLRPKLERQCELNIYEEFNDQIINELQQQAGRNNLRPQIHTSQQKYSDFNIEFRQIYENINKAKVQNSQNEFTPVSTQILDKDDLINNKQFQKAQQTSQEMSRQNSETKSLSYSFQHNKTFNPYLKRRNISLNMQSKCKVKYTPIQMPILSNEALNFSLQKGSFNASILSQRMSPQAETEAKIDDSRDKFKLVIKQISNNKQENLNYFLTQLDQEIHLKASKTANSNQTLEKEAKLIYQAIKGEVNDKGFTRFLLDVQRHYQQLQAHKTCCFKQLRLRHDIKMQGNEVPDTLNTKVLCQHTIEDDHLQQKNQNIMLWFLNFSKFVVLSILKKQNTFNPIISQIEQSYNPINLKKRSFRLQIRQTLLNCYKDFTSEEKEFITSKEGLKMLLNDPILKLTVIEKPKEVVEFKSQELGLTTDLHTSNVDWLVNNISKQILQEFKTAIFEVKKTNSVTFKVASALTKHSYKIFNQEQERTLFQNLTSKPHHHPKDEDEVEIDGVLTPKQISQVKEMDTEERLSREQVAELQLTQVDLVKQLINLHVAQDHKHLIKDLKDSTSPFKDQLLEEVKKFVIEYAISQRQYEQGDVSKSVQAEAYLNLPNSLKQKIVEAISNRSERKIVQIHGSQAVSQCFFRQGKQVSDGVQTGFEDEEQLQLFQSNKALNTLATPLLFKCLHRQVLFLHNQMVNEQQAQSIGEVLASNRTGTFAIKELIIDDCNMTDQAFANILQGINKQDGIKVIKYSNHNFLGPKSAYFLKQICARNSKSNILEELVLDNIKICYPENVRTDTNPLNQVLCEIDGAAKLKRLKLSCLDLSDRNLAKVVGDIIETNYSITHVNLANSNLQLKDLARICASFQNCSKLEYLNLSYNKITTSGIKDQQVFEMRCQIGKCLATLIELKPSALKILDIAEMDLKTRQLREICKAIQKNVTLKSVNLGTLQELEYLMVFKMLNFKPLINDSDIYLSPQSFKPESVVFNLKSVLINTGILRENQRAQKFNYTRITSCGTKVLEATKHILLNRFVNNPEIQIDEDCTTKWVQVEKCLVSNGSRYTQVFFNAKSIADNCFKPIRCPQELLLEIDARYPDTGIWCPLIFVNERFYPMLKPSVYYSLLNLKVMQEQLQQELANKEEGARGVTCVGPPGVTLTASQQMVHSELEKVLKEISLSDLRRIIQDLNNEILTPSSLRLMTNNQLKIASKFHQFNFQRALSKFQIENQYKIAIVNSQSFCIDNKFKKEVEGVRQEKKAAKEREKEMRMGLKKNAKVEQGPSSLFSSFDREHGGIRSEDSFEIQLHGSHFQQICYVWGGYLAAGKHCIVIYDRANRQLLQSEVVIEPSDEHPEFDFEINPLGDQQVQAIDQEYEADLQVELEHDRKMAEQKRLEDLKRREEAAAKQKGKKGKKKK